MTPLMKQYLSLKETHTDALLFFRLGDFYELFFDDAMTAAKLLQLTLTSRDKTDVNPVPMCGVPYHAAKGYIAKLIDLGHKVAICEQMEEPSGKGLVRREVTHIVTPGTALDDENLTPNAQNLLVSIEMNDTQSAIAYVDLSVGDAFFSEWHDTPDLSSALQAAVLRLNPRHVLIPTHLAQSPLDIALRRNLPHALIEYLPREENAAIATHATHETRVIPDDLISSGKQAIHHLLRYIARHQAELIDTLKPFTRFSDHAILPLDLATQTHLELFKTYDGQTKGSVFHHLNLTRTPMGARALRHRLTYPSVNIAEITARQTAVSALLNESNARHHMGILLDRVYDVERLTTKLVLKRATPKDVIALKHSFQALTDLSQYLNGDFMGERLGHLKRALVLDPSFITHIDKTLCDDPPLLVSEGRVIQSGVSPELDRLRHMAGSGRDYLADLERTERDKTGISSLKIRYNRVFGYYIEVTNTHKHKVPEHYIRKQTTATAERYLTEELKRVEDEILSAESKRVSLETALFNELCEYVATGTEAFRRAARAAAELDVTIALADVAERYGYVKPTLHTGLDMAARELRHPTLERALPKGQFVGNAISFDDAQRFILITGPNMAGKSTVMREVALLFILAQIGSFVPAEEATLGIIDQLFTRIGASDNLLKGQSTFMMEMTEAAHILRQATERSLIIFDEIGRGTSTFDGLSLARAIAEHVIQKIGAKTLFATHYHELAELERDYASVQGYTMSIREWQGELVFLYRFIKGNANKSYGIDVAKLAGLPQDVIARAKEVLAALELGETVSEEKLKPALIAKNAVATEQLSLFTHPNETVFARLRDLDLNRLTPIDALNLLVELKQAFE